jgi:hypothetical protein
MWSEAPEMTVNNMAGDFVTHRLAGDEAILAALVIGDVNEFISTVLSDPTTHSVALARDIAAFKVLLAARPSRAWRDYFDRWIAGTGLENELATLASGYPAALNAGMIVWAPNGTLARDTGRTIIRGGAGTLRAQARPRSGGFAQAVRVWVREGPNGGLEGWTIPDLMQHQGSLSQ